MIRINTHWNPPASYSPHFYLGRAKNRAKLYFRRTYSNIFLTLTDLRNKVIVCRTSGNSGIRDKKRKKCNALSIDKIVQVLSIHLKLYNIEHIMLITRMRLNRYYYCLKKVLRIMAL